MGGQRRPSRLLEREAWALSGDPQPPLHRCRRYELSPVKCVSVSTKEVEDVQRRLRRFGDYEVIYDWATTGDVSNPAHHVYKLVHKGGCPSDDVLVLAFMGQYDNSRVWPLGGPRRPGRWMVRELQRKLNGDVPDTVHLADVVAARRNKRIREAQAHAVKEVANMVTRRSLLVPREWKS